MRESLALLPSWVLAQKAAANRQLIAVMRQRLAAGEQVARTSGSAAGPGQRSASLDRPGPVRAALADSGPGVAPASL